MAGSGGGRFPPASRTSSSTGAKRPGRERPVEGQGEDVRGDGPGRPATPFTESEPVTASEKPTRISLRLDGHRPVGRRDPPGHRREPVRHGPGAEGGGEGALPPGGVHDGAAAHAADPGADHDGVGAQRLERRLRDDLGRGVPRRSSTTRAGTTATPGPIPVAEAAAVAADFASASVASATKRPSSTPGRLDRLAEPDRDPGGVGGDPLPLRRDRRHARGGVGLGGAAGGSEATMRQDAASQRRGRCVPHGLLLPENSPPVSSSSSAVISSIWFSRSARPHGLARRVERQLHEQPAALEVELGGAADPLLAPVDEAGGRPGGRRLVAGEDELVEVPAQADAELGGRVQAQVVGLDRAGDAHHPRVTLGAAGVERDAGQPVGAAGAGHPGAQPVRVDAVVVGRGPLHLGDGRVGRGDHGEDPLAVEPRQRGRVGRRAARRATAAARERPAGRRGGGRGAGARPGQEHVAGQRRRLSPGRSSAPTGPRRGPGVASRTPGRAALARTA